MYHHSMIRLCAISMVVQVGCQSDELAELTEIGPSVDPSRSPAAGAPAATSPAPAEDPQAEVMRPGSTGPEVILVYEYLQKYGYFPNKKLAAAYEGFRPIVDAVPADPSVFDAVLERGIKAYQTQHGIPVTGLIDAPTRRLMDAPRCGLPDTSTAPYKLASKWGKTKLTYTFLSQSSDLPKTQLDAALANAKSRWEDVADLTLTLVPKSPSDITVSFFAKMDHGPGFNDFDGPSNVLAWGHYPENGRLYFDEDETWSEALPIPSGSIDLQTVATHEFGHVLGLDHSNDTTAVMYAYYTGARRELSADDIDGIRKHYGASFGWHAGYNLPRTSNLLFTAGAGIAANSRTSEMVDLWAIGIDGALWNAGYWDGTWHEPYRAPLAAINSFEPGGGIAVNSRTANMVDTWVIGTDGGLWNAGYWDGQWHAGYRPPLPASDFIAGGGIAANSRTSSMVDTWTIGKDGALWNAGYWDGTWHAGYRMPLAVDIFVPGGGLAANSRTPEMVDTWAIGKDGALWNAGFWDGEFHPGYWVPTCPPGMFLPGSQVAAVSRTPSMVDIWVIGKDGALWNAGFWDGAWHVPYRAPKSTVETLVPGGGIAANSRFPDIVDTWAIGDDSEPANTGWWSIP